MNIHPRITFALENPRARGLFGFSRDSQVYQYDLLDSLCDIPLLLSLLTLCSSAMLQSLSSYF